jgi:hypothetical protein
VHHHHAGDQAGGATVAEWPLPALVAYLFEGREEDEVRALLARGEGEAHGAHITWEPVDVSADELTRIQGEFPRMREPAPLDRQRVVSIALTVPALHPTLSVPIRGDHPLVAVAASRAAYLCFDYGPWADIYVATLTRDEAAELLDDPARRGNDEGAAELAKRIIGEDDAALRFAVPREDAPPPWHGEP